ncbi:hypothetical protein HQN90_27405 [Paenibacillus alba]|uniref:stalk domain-containing protein n=1 Tax=Paenibacillus alba TaxID=1197127 RepID=UPI001566AEF5|nr:stalk domain-containing protein [Paenibacillus alba]NQX69866.1 hypothetical protein [Paenibacillus alba]
MKKIFTKKVLTVITAISVVTAIGSVAYADSALKQITAYQNQNLKVSVNGSAVDMSSEDGIMYPLVYEGHSYVSAKALAEKLGATVKWNNDTQTVEVTSGSVSSNSGIPNKDNSGPASTPKPTPVPTPPPATSSSNSGTGTLDNPVSLGSSLSYYDVYNYGDGKYDSPSADYTVTVKKVTPITDNELVNLGFAKPEKSSTVGYVLLDVNLKTKNAKIKKGTDSKENGYAYLHSTYRPSIWGSQTPDDSGKIIGGKDYGFDGSLESLLYDDYFIKILPGDSGSFEVTGKILLPVLKNQENLLVLEKRAYDLKDAEKKIYFKLQ